MVRNFTNFTFNGTNAFTKIFIKFYAAIYFTFSAHGSDW